MLTFTLVWNFHWLLTQYDIYAQLLLQLNNIKCVAPSFLTYSSPLCNKHHNRANSTSLAAIAIAMAITLTVDE